MFVLIIFIYASDFCHKRFELACNRRRGKLEVEKSRRRKVQTNMGTVKFNTWTLTELEFALSILVLKVRREM